MAIVTGSWLVDLVLTLLTAFTGLYLFYQRQFQFWRKLHVPHTSPSVPFGDMSKANTVKTSSEAIQDIYIEYKGLKFLGMWILHRPILMVRDPDLIKSILVKDFMAFQDRGVYINEEDDPLAAHLFSIAGTKWRNLRIRLTPTFTSGKMKMMFPTMVATCEELKSVLKGPAQAGQVVEVRDLAARFTTDVISSCAFGIESNSLKNPNAIFRVMGKKAVDPTIENAIRGFIPFLVPDLAKILKLRQTPKEISDFFLGAVKETIDYRKQNKVTRKDFMELLIQLMDKGALDDVDDGENEMTEGREEKIRRFTFNEAAAQAFVFFIAGFETSSTTMQFAMYELACNPELQEQTRREVRRVLDKHGGLMTYEGVHEMDLLGRVIDETLRKYPPVGVLLRETTREYMIPGTQTTIPRGIQVQVPVYAIQNDPEYFPNPERFDPGRFTEEEKAKRHHYTYLPFGDGPRNCIGMRFGLMQVKVGLITLLSNFRFQLGNDMPIPLEFDPKAFIFQPKSGVHLKVTTL